MAVDFVDLGITANAGNGTVYNDSYTPGAGQKLLVVTVQGTNAEPTGVSSSQGGAMTKVPGAGATNGRSVSVWYKLHTFSAAATTITVTFGVAQGNCITHAMHITGSRIGNSGADAFRNVGTNTGTSTSSTVQTPGPGRHANNGLIAATSRQGNPVIGGYSFSANPVDAEFPVQAGVAGENSRLYVIAGYGFNAFGLANYLSFTGSSSANDLFAAVIIEVDSAASWTAALDDIAAATETIQRNVALLRSMSDSAPAADSPAKSASRAKACSDSAPASDSVARTVAFARGVADSAPASDTLDRDVLMTRAISDSALCDDALAKSSAMLRMLADNADCTDSVARSIVAARALTDSAPATDDLIRSLSYFRFLEDDAFCADDLTFKLVGNVNLVDSAPVMDVITRRVALRRLLFDDAPTTDTVIAYEPAPTLCPPLRVDLDAWLTGVDFDGWRNSIKLDAPGTDVELDGSGVLVLDRSRNDVEVTCDDS